MSLVHLKDTVESIKRIPVVAVRFVLKVKENLVHIQTVMFPSRSPADSNFGEGWRGGSKTLHQRASDNCGPTVGKLALGLMAEGDGCLTYWEIA